MTDAIPSRAAKMPALVKSNAHLANLAWERFNPDKVSVPKFDAESSAWRSGYLAALQDMGFEDA